MDPITTTLPQDVLPNNDPEPTGSQDGNENGLAALSLGTETVGDEEIKKPRKRRYRQVYDCPLPIARPIIGEGGYAREDIHDANTGQGDKVVKPHPNDAVFWAAVQALEEYNGMHDPDRTLAQFADPLCIEALSACPTPMLTAYDTIPVVHVLTRHELFVKLQLQLQWGLLREQWQGIVMVLLGDHWEPLSEYIKTLPAYRMSLVGASGIKLQCAWWRSRRQPFRFVDLPSELLKMLLLHLIGTHVTVKPMGLRHAPGYSLIQGEERIYYEKFDQTLPKLDPIDEAIFRLNKETARVAREALWAATTKVFFPSYDFILPAGHVHTSSYTCYLRRVELVFKNHDLIRWFGIPLPPFVDRIDTLDADPCVQDLVNIPNLESLSIYFRSTITAGNSPWAFMSDDQACFEMDTDRKPCQKLLVEYMLPFIFPHIRKVPNARLTGYVKNPTKRFWEGLLNSPKHMDHTAFITQRQKAIRALPRDTFPPECRCKNSCAFDRVDDMHEDENQRFISLKWKKRIYEKYEFEFEDPDEDKAPKAEEVTGAEEDHATTPEAAQEESE